MIIHEQLLLCISLSINSARSRSVLHCLVANETRSQLYKYERNMTDSVYARNNAKNKLTVKIMMPANPSSNHHYFNDLNLLLKNLNKTD